MHISRREDLIDHGCNDGRRYEIQNEERENFAEADFLSAAVFFSSCADQCQHQCNRNNRQGTSQLNRNRLVQRCGAQTKHGIPCACRCCYGRSVVDRRSRKYTKRFAGGCVKANCFSQHREKQRCQYIKEENNGNRLRYFLIIRINDRSCRCDRRSTTNGGTHADQCGNFTRNMHYFV